VAASCHAARLGRELAGLGRHDLRTIGMAGRARIVGQLREGAGGDGRRGTAEPASSDASNARSPDRAEARASSKAPARRPASAPASAT
jgi:hypothetical protein